MDEAVVYIHYGHKHFDPGKFDPIKNRFHFCKPLGGLWASPVNAKMGWKDWCEKENFRDCKEDNAFKFRLKDGSKVHHIYCKEDVEKLPHTPDKFFDEIYPDFEEIAWMGYDAIEYHLSDEKAVLNYKDGLYWVLYGWDCDCILVLKKEAVEVIE